MITNKGCNSHGLKVKQSTVNKDQYKHAKNQWNTIFYNNVK